MTMPAIQTPNTRTKRHDRSFIAQPLARPLQPTGEQPGWLQRRAAAEDYPAEPNWLVTESHLPVLDGLDHTWWQLLPASLSALFATWRKRARDRRELAQIDARSLREAGIDPGVADFEAAQPFWRKPMTLRDLPAFRAPPLTWDCIPVGGGSFAVC